MQYLVVLFLSCIAVGSCAIQYSDRLRNFSIELVHYTQLETKGHAVISPFGIWTLMAGMSLGATGRSHNQMEKALALPKDSIQLIRVYKELTSTVLTTNTRSEMLTIKNFVFLDSNYTVFPDFRRTLELNFSTAVENLNFEDPKAVEIIDRKIQKTGSSVRNVLRSDDFAHSRMIPANVVAFRGLWSYHFNKTKTQEEIFYDEDRNPMGRVNMMYQNSVAALSNIKAMQSYALEMPYGEDGKYSMLFILPYPGVKIADAYKKLAHISMWDIFGQLKNESEHLDGQETEVRIPRFHIRTNFLMNIPLINMGVSDIFVADRAKFDRITNEDIFISAIVHTADIKVTESSTVASATSTATFVEKKSSRGFFANRPFMYFLMEKSTMTMIFGGIYSKPTVY